MPNPEQPLLLFLFINVCLPGMPKVRNQASRKIMKIKEYSALLLPAKRNNKIFQKLLKAYFWSILPILGKI